MQHPRSLVSLLATLVLTFSASSASIADMVIISTSKGDIKLSLFSEEAPITAANFLKYVDDGFFANTVFHRVIPGFMIQGGGMTRDLREKPNRAPIKNEAANGVKNLRGTIAMARTSDPHSASSQFFINLSDNHFLNMSPGNPGYAVFGKVVSGMEVVDAIAAVPTERRLPHSDVPKEAVVITGVRRADRER